MQFRGWHRYFIDGPGHLGLLLIIGVLTVIGFFPLSKLALANEDVLSVNEEKVSAALAIRYSGTNSGQLLIEDVLPGPASKVEWQRNQASIPNFGFGPAAMWFWLPIHNPTDEPLERFIEIQNPVLDEVILYQVKQGDRLVSHQISGDRHPMSERPADHFNLVFPIEIPAGAHQDLYFKVMTDGSMQLPVFIWSPRAFHQADQLRLLGFGVLFGVLVVMACYNLFAFLMLQDRVFMYYAGYALSLAFFEAAMNGFGNQYLWADSWWWREHSVVLFVPVLVGFGSLFARSFLQLKLSQRWLYDVFGWLFHGALLSAFLSLILPYALIIKISAVLAFLVCVLSVVVGVYRWRHGYRPARYFILAWALFLLSVLAYVAGKFGLIPQSVWTERAMHLGAVFGSIVSAFALTDRVNSQRLSYMEAQKSALLMQKAAKQDLEKVVDERTQALQTTLSQLEEANEQLQSISMLDGLTGIKNRRFFNEKIEREWARAIRNNSPIALLAIDIDHFKQFNDNYGHLLGDECLRHVAQVIQESVARPSDTVSRYGGEEFMVILPDTDIHGAMHIAEEIRQSIEQQSFHSEGKTYHLTTSIGVSANTPLYGTSYELLISEADRALYQSKKRGRNCVTAF